MKNRSPLKRVIASLRVLPLCLAVAACGDDEAAQQAGGVPPPTVTVVTVSERDIISIISQFQFAGRLAAGR